MEKSEVIYGPPGTGKTTTLVGKIRQLMESGIESREIGVVSFTKAAAREMADRTGQRPGGNISTLHSYGFRLAGIIRDQVMSKDWLKEFSKVSNIEVSGASNYEIEDMAEGDSYMALYSYARSTLNDDHKMVFKSSPVEGSLAKYLYFVETYESFKAAYGVVDFSDMIDLAVGKDPGVKVMILDEAQDFTPQQWRLIESWVPYVEQMILAGDDDQAIYKWNGASPAGMSDFEKKYGSTRQILGQSYRVPVEVHTLAQNLIRNIKDRVEKEYKPTAHHGKVRRYGDVRNLNIDPDVDTLILVRNHSLRKDIEELMIQKNIPFVAEGGKPAPLNGFHAAAIKVWETGRRNFESSGMDVLTDRQRNLLSKAAKPQFQSKVRDLEDMLERGYTWDRVLYLPHHISTYLKGIISQYGTIEMEPKIKISTIHGSKGREADRVILINGMSQRTSEGDDVDSEIRTFYVAVTRAKKELDIVASQNPLKVLK